MLRRFARPITRSFFGSSKQKPVKETGLFDNADLQTTAGIQKLPEKVLASSQRLLEELLEPSTSQKRTALQIVDDLSNEICKAADLTECVRQLHDEESFRAAAESASRDFCGLIETLNTNTELYRTLKESEEVDKERLDDVDRRTLKLYLDDFEQSGVHLEEEKKRQFVDLSEEIFDASARFQEACDEPVKVNKADQSQYGLATRIVTPIDHSSDRNKRKFVYNNFYRHSAEQEDQLRRLIGARDRMAKLTGFESFAHRAQNNSLLKNYENAKSFLLGVIEKCQEASKREIAVLIDIQSQLGNLTGKNYSNIVAEWDVHFLTHLYKDSAFDITRRYRAVEQYFTISSVLHAFSTITERIYGVKLVESSLKRGELWEADCVFKLEAVDEQNNHLGTIYVDTSIRPEKASGDCHYTVRCSKMLENGWQTPILVLSVSLQDVAIPWQNVHINPNAAETMFHELGHAMHSILGRTRYQHVAGTRCPQDFSEIPSNLMQYFFGDINVMREVLKKSQVLGAAPMSMDDAATILASRGSFTAIETVQQAAYSLYDLEVHGPEAAPMIADGRLSTTDLFHSIMKNAMPHVKRDPNSAFQHRFHHTCQYGAKYYSYLVAKAGASLIWQQTFQKDPFSREYGRRWAEVQSHGGGHPPSVLLKQMLGFDVTATELTEALSSECTHLANLDAISV